MKITVYRYVGDPLRVYKTGLIDSGSGGYPPIELEGDLRDESAVSDPVMLIETDANLSYYNYAYVDYFARYYFARFEVVRTGVWRVYLHVDVLANAGYYIAEDTVIGDIKALVGRSEDTAIWNKKLMDESYPINPNKKYRIISTPTHAGTINFNYGNADGVTSWFVLHVAGLDV